MQVVFQEKEFLFFLAQSCVLCFGKSNSAHQAQNPHVGLSCVAHMQTAPVIIRLLLGFNFLFFFWAKQMFKILDLIWMIITTWLDLLVQLMFSDTGTGNFPVQWGIIKKPSKSNQTAVWPYHIFPDIWGKNDLRIKSWLWRLRKTQLAFASRPGCCGAPGETKPLTHLCQLFKERWKTKLGIVFIWKILSPLFKERSRTKLGIVFAWMENSVCKLLWRPNLPNFCVSSSKND